MVDDVHPQQPVQAYTGSIMASSLFHAKPHAEVLRGVFDLAGRGLSQPLAEGILALDFPPDDAARMDELGQRANDGRLTQEEAIELETYVNISDLLAFWQAKARQAS